LRSVGVVAFASVVLAAAMLWWLHGRGSAPRSVAVPHANRSTRVTASSVPASPTASGQRSIPPTVSSVAPARHLDAAAARQVLGRLDRIRARAYARREPALLKRVYVRGPLRTRDVAQLRSTVPAGCALIGASTSYADPAVTARHGAEVTVRVTTRLHTSTLSCGGAPAGHARASKPRTLRITVHRSQGGYRIASIT
jgi:hypothetical protein